MARLTGYELTRGVLCAMRRPRPKDFREVCAGTRRVAVLENVVDSTNVGAIIRSTVFQIPWVYIGEQPADWPSPGLDWLNELGFKTAAMALREDSVSIDDEGLAAEPKLAIVLGTEGTGLTARTAGEARRCRRSLRISPKAKGGSAVGV